MWWLAIGLTGVATLVVLVEFIHEYWDDFSYHGTHRGTYQFKHPTTLEVDDE
jgi:hypothetical protein